MYIEENAFQGKLSYALTKSFFFIKENICYMLVCGCPCCCGTRPLHKPPILDCACDIFSLIWSQNPSRFLPLTDILFHIPFRPPPNPVASGRQMLASHRKRTTGYNASSLNLSACLRMKSWTAGLPCALIKYKSLKRRAAKRLASNDDSPHPPSTSFCFFVFVG